MPLLRTPIKMEVQVQSHQGPHSLAARCNSSSKIPVHQPRRCDEFADKISSTTAHNDAATSRDVRAGELHLFLQALEANSFSAFARSFSALMTISPACPLRSLDFFKLSVI